MADDMQKDVSDYLDALKQAVAQLEDDERAIIGETFLNEPEIIEGDAMDLLDEYCSFTGDDAGLAALLRRAIEWRAKQQRRSAAAKAGRISRVGKLTHEAKTTLRSVK